MSHIVSFASDGAKVRIGCHNGVNSRLKRNVNHVFAVHCVAHRLALASVDAADEANYHFGVYRTTIQSPHNYIDHSSVRREELVLWQETGERTSADGEKTMWYLVAFLPRMYLFSTTLE